jgi:carbonic anhydrase
VCAYIYIYIYIFLLREHANAPAAPLSRTNARLSLFLSGAPGAQGSPGSQVEKYYAAKEAAAAAHSGCHWTYEEETEWGSVCDDKYPTCSAGKSQSPIDVVTSNLKVVPASQTLGWNIPDKAAGEYAHFVKGKGGDVSMEEYNGHTFQVSHLAATFTYNKIVYNLKQFHLHTKSEHSINGKQADLEIQFVHTTDDAAAENKVLVVGAFFNVLDGYSSPSFIKELVEAIPKVGETPAAVVPVNFFEVAQTVMIGSLAHKGSGDAGFIPNFKNYMTYQGSFTTPPCTGPPLPRACLLSRVSLVAPLLAYVSARQHTSLVSVFSRFALAASARVMLQCFVAWSCIDGAVD